MGVHELDHLLPEAQESAVITLCSPLFTGKGARSLLATMLHETAHNVLRGSGVDVYFEDQLFLVLTVAHDPLGVPGGLALLVPDNYAGFVLQASGLSPRKTSRRLIASKDTSIRHRFTGFFRRNDQKAAALEALTMAVAGAEQASERAERAVDLALDASKESPPQTWQGLAEEGPSGELAVRDATLICRGRFLDCPMAGEPVTEAHVLGMERFRELVTRFALDFMLPAVVGPRLVRKSREHKDGLPVEFGTGLFTRAVRFYPRFFGLEWNDQRDAVLDAGLRRAKVEDSRADIARVVNAMLQTFLRSRPRKDQPGFTPLEPFDASRERP